MSRSNLFPIAFLVLTIIVMLESQQSQSIAPEQVQKICACTNSTKDDCITIMNSNPTFTSAPDIKALVPLVATTAAQSAEKALDYAKSLKADDKDEKLKTLYKGCAILYEETTESIKAVIEAIKAGDSTKVKDNLEEAVFNVHDCSIGPKELDVTDTSNLESYNKEVKALLDIFGCVIEIDTES